MMNEATPRQDPSSTAGSLPSADYRGMIGFLLFMVIVASSITTVSFFENKEQDKRIERIERVVVQYPCTKGRDANCREFLGILLNGATKTQLRELLRAKSLKVSGEDLERFLRQVESRPQKTRIPKMFGPPKSVVPVAPRPSPQPTPPIRVLTPAPEPAPRSESRPTPQDAPQAKDRRPAPTKRPKNTPGRGKGVRPGQDPSQVPPGLPGQPERLPQTQITSEAR